MTTTIEFRDDYLDNNPHMVNNPDRETILMKAYALHYYDTKTHKSFKNQLHEDCDEWCLYYCTKGGSQKPDCLN